MRNMIPYNEKSLKHASAQVVLKHVPKIYQTIWEQYLHKPQNLLFYKNIKTSHKRKNVAQQILCFFLT